MKSGWLKALTLIFSVLVMSGCGTSSYRPAPVQDRSVDRHRPTVQSAVKADHYMVRKGDTLYSIAFRYKLHYQDLARWNGIGPPYTIYPGQQLGMTAQASAYAIERSPRTIPARPVDNRQPRRLPPVQSSTGSSNDNQTTNNSQQRGTVVSTPAPSAPRTTEPVVVATAPRNNSGINWLWPVAGGRVNRRFVAGENSRQGLDISGGPGQPVLATAAGTVVYSGPGLTGYAELIIIKHSQELLSAYGHNRRRLVQEGETVKAGQQIAELGRSPRGEDELHFQIRRLGKPQNPQNYLPKR